MVLFLEITNIWQRSKDFCFADFFLEIYKIHWLVRIFLWIFFGCFECVSSMFCLFKVITNLKFLQTVCLKLLLILNFTNAVLSKTTFFHRMVTCAHAPHGGMEGGRQYTSFRGAVLLKLYQKLAKKTVTSKIWTKAKKVNEHPPPTPPKKSIG